MRHRVYFSFLILVLPLALLVQACHPSYTLEETRRYSRSLGLIDDFDIKRWHSFSFARDSRFAVAVASPHQVRRQVVADTALQSLSIYFAGGSNLSRYPTADTALTAARKQGGDFLFFMELLDLQGGDPDEVGSSDYVRAHMLITIFDVNSKKVIDKVTMTADKAMMPLLSDELSVLLVNPLRAVAKELAGA